MARQPKYNDKEARERILRAARKIFAQRGFRATSMDDIAAEINVAKPFLYRYFAGKDELHETVIEEGITRYIDPLKDLLVSNENKIDVAIKATDVFADLVANNPDTYTILFQPDITSEGAGAERLEGLYEYFAQEIARVLRQDSIIDDLSQSSMMAEMILASAHAAARNIAKAETEDERDKLSHLMHCWMVDTLRRITPDELPGAQKLQSHLA